MRRGAEAGSGGIEVAAAGSTRPRGNGNGGHDGAGHLDRGRRRSAQHGHDAVDERQRLCVRQERIGIATRRGRPRFPLHRIDQRRRAGHIDCVLRSERGEVMRRPTAHHRIDRSGLGGCDHLAHAVVPKPIEGAAHVKPFGVTAARNHDQLAVALLPPCRGRDRPDRCPAGAAPDEDNRPIAFAQKCAAERPADLHAVARLDRRANLRGHESAGVAPDMEDQLAGRGRAVEPHRGAEVACREARELDTQILSRAHGHRRIEQHRNLDDVGRELGDARHQSGPLRDFGHMVERDRRVADHLGLASKHGALVSSSLVVNLTAHDGHAAGLALPRAAVVRDRDPAGKAGVDERLPAIGLDGLAVDDEVETHAHSTDHSLVASSYSCVMTRTGRAWRV